uniref:Uncharacterized protein n=1 Tax=viral metagenome TaxID=1070528 RepID=A0A6C0D3J3_9ZZZZ
MVLSGTKKTTYRSSLVNQNQGGGSKKAGLWPQVGRESYTNVVMGIQTGVQNKHCVCSLKCLQYTANPKVRQSRNIGSSYNSNYGYWSIPGTGH